jgi:peptidylprolyl isomerase
MTYKYSFLFISILSILVGCSNNKTKTDLMDSLKATNLEEKWDPIVPDTAAMRKKYAVVEIVTNLGTMELALFDATPKHRDNFIKLIESGFYNDLLFHRIKKEFMIQGGDPESKKALPGTELGQGGPGYNIDAEILDSLHHFKGALCAARMGDDLNPAKKSSGSQFYIVSGSKFNTTALKNAIKDRAIISFLSNPDNLSYQMRIETYQKRSDNAAMQVLMDELAKEVKPLTDSLYNDIPARARQMYATWGGFPVLDKEYTIFGFLIKGYETLEKAEKVKTSSGDRPVEDVKILSARLIKKPQI